MTNIAGAVRFEPTNVTFNTLTMTEAREFSRQSDYWSEVSGCRSPRQSGQINC